MSYKQMKEENVRKILRLPVNFRKELNEAFGLFLSNPLQRYPNTEETPQIERDLFQNQIQSVNLKTILRALGYEPRRDELKKLLMYVDSSDQIDIFQFLLIMIKKMELPDTKEELLKAFRLFDKLDTGYIGIEEMKALSAECGYKFNDAEINQMIEEGDRDQDGLINEEEFLRVMKRGK
ncbi:Centrin [Hexamita inflata]|uniref:Centrin n=1 Tax=Hexamita inflata TaxID=28002 RepID=A0AA86NBI1_9EUKA|nr:Centrin [Hexamita inflata]CAI9939783.1 Centrin [Hexamita inflata]CAI9940877.1 Centrin [Hexamita inflata]CAI9972149.1 Centrin [Hexamita inflata]